MTQRTIPFHRPAIGETEIAAVANVMRSGWLTTGPVTAAFENQFAEYIGAPHAVAVNSCSSGLQLALKALDIGPGDEIITSPITFCATVLAILHTGATPVLADVGADGNLDPASVESRISPSTKALLPVHLAGAPCDMEAFWAIARKHHLLVVEDAAHALSARYVDGPRVGGDSRSDAAVFSFYATKALATGEGGMISAHRPELGERLRLLRHHGIGKRRGWRYSVEEQGFKFNLSDIHSAIGIEQLKRQDEFLEARARCAAIYAEELRNTVIGLPAAVAGHCWHLYRIAVPTRDTFIERMKERGVECSVHFIPIPLHPAFAGIAGGNDCPRALAQFEHSVSLPIYPGMPDDDIRYVAACARECATAP
ncbi:MAG TPA: DegT/DnrJ/EryC1/StrS family aminotransferase [Bryobacteraceae bacterium]|nr:DegT/DnrJ/EryC1/StrS family aminotransferase [Bryobacteraceae bacterium]